MVTRAKFQWSHDSSDSVREEDEDEAASVSSNVASNSKPYRSSGINILVGSDTTQDDEPSLTIPTKAKKYLRHRYANTEKHLKGEKSYNTFCTSFHLEY